MPRPERLAMMMADSQTQLPAIAWRDQPNINVRLVLPNILQYRLCTDSTQTAHCEAIIGCAASTSKAKLALFPTSIRTGASFIATQLRVSIVHNSNVAPGSIPTAIVAYLCKRLGCTSPKALTTARHAHTPLSPRHITRHCCTYY